MVDFAWALKPAPGQFGATADRSEQPTDKSSDESRDDSPDQSSQERGPDDEMRAPYGFRRMEPIGMGPYSPYIPTGENPALKDRPAREWGSDDWVLEGMNKYRGGTPEGLHIPNERDIPGIIHNATMQLGQWAAPGIAMPMIASARLYAAAQKGYMQGQIQAANMHRQQALLNMQQAQYKLQDQIRRYGNAWATWGPSDKDPGDADKLHEQLYRIASDTQDSTVLRMLEQHDWKGIEKLMKHLDGQSQDVAKARALIGLELDKERLKEAQRKDKEREDQNKEWFGTPKPSVPTPKPATETPESPATAVKPGDKKAADSAEKPAEEPAETPTEYELPTAPPRINQEAQAEQMGIKHKLPNEQIISAVDGQREKLDDYMHNLTNDKRLSADDVKARIRQANPGMAELVNGLLDGTTELTATDSAKPHMQIATALAKRIDPEWKRNSQHLRDQRQHLADVAEIAGVRSALGIQHKLYSNMADVLEKNANDMVVLVDLARKLKAHGKLSQIPVANDIMLKGEERLLGDPEVAAYQLQLREVRSDIGKVLVNSGAGAGTLAVATQHEMEKLLPGGATPEQLLAQTRVLKRDYANKLQPIAAQIDALNLQISHITKTAPIAPIDYSELEKRITADEMKVIGGKKYYLREGKWHDE